jgi:nitrous oxidase accessory protein
VSWRRGRELGGVVAGLALALVGLALPAAAATSFQRLVDATPTGGVLRPAPGSYAGPVVIDRPMRIFGGGEVTIRNDGSGTVVAIHADGIELRGLRLVGSGANHDRLDAGIRVRGHRNVIEDNRIEDCLFGIELQKSDENLIRGNRIRSKPFDMGVRGDGIRLWYSMRNRILENEIIDVRDTVVWYSADNVIARNRASGCRYSLHFMYSERNRVEENDYGNNLVGIFLMYSDGLLIRNNRIYRSVGSTGMGIGFKESSDVRIEQNALLNNATGIYLDISPYQPDAKNEIVDNRIAYNGVGVLFHTDWTGNVFRGNRFEGNHTQVAVRGSGSALRNEWLGNYWDDYRGFDRDRDGTGDTPYELRSWADRLWMDVPAAAFFRASPVLEALDLLERLSPMSSPTLVLRDARPIHARVGD